MRLWLGLALACAVGCIGVVSEASAAGTAKIQVLSNRADLISGGDALVAVSGVDASRLKVTVGGRDVSSAFALRPNGRIEGIVSGLSLGANVLTASSPGVTTAKTTITNHAIGGPVIAGPQVQPWVCTNGSSDPQCNAPTTYSYQYKSSTTGQLAAYDPANPPSDVASTTTDQGVTVPFIVRTETGYQDRDQYQIATLFQPGKDWSAWAPQEQWNHKLLITHGASCGIDHQSGSAPSVTGDTAGAGGSPTEALGRGFAVMSTALDNAGPQLLAAHAGRVADHGQGAPRRDLRRAALHDRHGCSGGSLTQQQVANAYPGIYQGILPQCSFPDAWSTGQQLADYHLTRGYFEDPSKWGPGIVWTPAQIAAVEGHPNHVNSIILDSLYFTALGDPTNACAGVSDAERWSESNPGGVRCTLADYMVNALGKRASDGYAGRPLDNVGVQYGLTALQQGLITPGAVRRHQRADRRGATSTPSRCPSGWRPTSRR